jgi:hypothetical protein
VKIWLPQLMSGEDYFDNGDGDYDDFADVGDEDEW